MGKIISIIGGLIAVVLAIILMFLWNEAFRLGLEFMIIFVLALGGLIAVVAGVSELKDAISAKKETAKEEEKK